MVMQELTMVSNMCRAVSRRINSMGRGYTHGPMEHHTQGFGETASMYSCVCGQIRMHHLLLLHRMHGKGCYTDQDEVKWEGQFYNGKFNNGKSFVSLR
jgi:hypothetical protein